MSTFNPWDWNGWDSFVPRNRPRRPPRSESRLVLVRTALSGSFCLIFAALTSPGQLPLAFATLLALAALAWGTVAALLWRPWPEADRLNEWDGALLCAAASAGMGALALTGPG